jgi:replicative DNA helicase
MATFNLKQCNGLCHQCVKQYIDKHHLRKGEQFGIPCRGIPSQYIPDSILASLGEDPKAAIAMMDPVIWANVFLDWHCFDPDGAIWKRKTAENSLSGLPPYIESEHADMVKKGKSIFHRPYQAEMLRCSSKRKIFRIGRQAGKTETLCVMIAYNIFTHENFAVEVIAPYQNQVDLIFGRLSDMIYSNKTLANSVAHNVKAPSYQIELNNESYVIGFTAGTRSGQEGASARGQTANMLVFDESDYLSSKDIDSALAVIINHPDATVWMSSTPTGRREKFYDSCQSRKYREFHYPSSINPNWNKELDDYYKEELTEDGYKHEILADFGEQEEGVYQLKYVEAAQANYSYEQMKPLPSWTYMVGVDWNDFKIGTTIAVVGFNPHDGLYYLVDKKIVSRAERTQLSACQKIAELNRMWNPAFIYVDQGYGATQIEVLHDYGGRSLQQLGPNHPDSRLRTIVKGFDFGGTQEIYDIFTKQPVKKPAKPFLVENSVRRFESLQFKYPKADKNYTDQLLGYIIDRVSVTGRPVYEAQNDTVGDHFIDAVNLALIAFTLEKSKFAKPVYSQAISFAPRFGAGEDQPKNDGPRDVVSSNYKPRSGRAETVTGNSGILQPSTGDMPASNNSGPNTTKIWDWPGFGHDAPRPTPRTMREAYRQASERVFGRSSGHNRPKRAKF